MKKQIIAALAIAFVAVANAATINWAETASAIYDGTGTTTKIDAGTAVYLLIGGTADASALVGAMTETGYQSVVSGMAAATDSLTSKNKIDATSTIANPGGQDLSAYFVLFNGDDMYVSDITATDWDSLAGEYNAKWLTQTTPSKAAAMDASNGYSGAGWYTAAAVPEPTSALMLLLGMAGLALKRKVA